MNRISKALQLGMVCVLMFGTGMTRQSDPQVFLRPDRPQTYLELGERLAANASREPDIEHAAQVLAMGVVMAQRNADGQLAASCCIALSTIANEPGMQRDLWDLALLLDPKRFRSWAAHRTKDAVLDDARDAADCLRLIRNAEYQDASSLFSKPAVQSRLRMAASTLGYEPETTLQRIQSLLASGGADECNGRVFVSRVRDGESSKHLCDDHSHPVGAAPDEATLKMLLSIELECMNGLSQLRSWGGETAMSFDQPMRLPDTRLIQSRYKVTPDHPYWDGSRWTPKP